MSVIIPEGYRSLLDIRQTEVAIKKVKDFFERDLAIQLNLTRVSAPLFVERQSGLNDTLNGVERPVAFDIKGMDYDMEIVQSLAKWKRYALGKYGFKHGEGLYTDMNAIRRDEDTDNLHSVFVDQWDWERIIYKEERNVETLKSMVRRVYRSIRHTERYIAEDYSFSELILPEEIFCSRRNESLGPLWGFTVFTASSPSFLYLSSFLFGDLHAVVRNNAERARVGFIHFLQW